MKNGSESGIFSGNNSRLDMGGMLGWEEGEQREGFRKLLDHPKLREYLRLLLGEGYRLDHSPLVIA